MNLGLFLFHFGSESQYDIKSGLTCVFEGVIEAELVYSFSDFVLVLLHLEIHCQDP